MDHTSLNSLSFEHLEEQCQNFIDQLSVESGQVNSGPLVNRVLDYGQDLTLLNAVVQGMRVRKGVSKQDILALESLRPKYPALDAFLNNTPLAMYTTESSSVMFEPSLEAFITNAASALWKALSAFSQWIYDAMQKTWTVLIHSSSESRKVDAKLPAFYALCNYVDVVGNALMVAGMDISSKQARNQSLQDLNKDMRDNELAYLSNPTLYHREAKVLNDLLSNYMPVLTNQIRQLTIEMTVVKTPEEVESLKTIYSQHLLNRPSIVKLVKELGQLRQGSGNVKPTLEGVIEYFRFSALSTANLGKAQIHPKVMQTLVSNPAVFQPMDPNVYAFISADLPEMVKTAKVLSNKLSIPADLPPAVSEAFTKSRFLDVLTEYQTQLRLYTTLQEQLMNILDVRSKALSKVINSILNEVKLIDKWVGNNKNTLPLDIIAVRDTQQKLAMSAVRSARM